MDNEQLMQLAISQGQPRVITTPSGKSYKVRPISNAVLDRMSGYIVRQVPIDKAETPELIAKLKPNLKLQSKAISLALLSDTRLKGIAGRLKVMFFHWIYWRHLHWDLTPADISALLSEVIDKMFLVFFYQNMALTKGINSLEKKKTREEVELLQAEQESEKKQDS